MKGMAEWPVTLSLSRHRVNEGAQRKLKGILARIDFTEKSVPVLKSAVYYADKFNASLDAIFIVENFRRGRQPS